VITDLVPYFARTIGRLIESLPGVSVTGVG
jgi:hypothetical protein